MKATPMSLQSRSRMASITRALLACFVIALAQRSPGQIAVSTFKWDHEGWQLTADAVSPVPTWFRTGGVQDGFLRGYDKQLGQTIFWEAPAKFLGDMRNAYNARLSFSLRQSTLTQQSGADGDIKISGGGMTLVYDNLFHPGTTWTPYSIRLHESELRWHLGTIDGPRPSQEQFLSVLAHLDRLLIRGEYSAAQDTFDLDNVVVDGFSESRFIPVPLPTYNARLQNVDSQFPEGDVELGSVPFRIPRGQNNFWSSNYVTGTNPRTLAMPVSIDHANIVHMLLNTGAFFKSRPSSRVLCP